MVLSHFSQEKLLPILISRTTVFLFLMSLLTLFLYMAGTFQNFIDATQLFLLRLYSVLGVLLCISSICGSILDLNRFKKAKKSRYLFRAGGYILLVIYGLATSLAVIAIIAISEGSAAYW